MALYQATVVLHFKADTLAEARDVVDQAIEGGVGTTSAVFAIVSVRREGAGERRAAKRG